MVAVFGGIGALNQAQARARDADLLQSLAMQKLNEIGPVSSPDTVESDGDFTDQGYPEVTWSIDVQPSGAENVDTVTVTATRGDQEQSLTGMVFVPPLTTTGTGMTAAGAATP